MPWKETCAMDQRMQFVMDWRRGVATKSALCDAYGISRPTGDKWIRRYEEMGVEGLLERSRAPHLHPNAVSEEVRQMIQAVKLKHQRWGPRKVMDFLRGAYQERSWPVNSTAGEILKRAGLVTPRGRRRRVAGHPDRLGVSERPNAIWSADYKGDFRLGNGKRCYPLTVSDHFSRFGLQCRGLAHPDTESTRPWFEWVFRSYGLPEVIRTDNGSPFASLALGGLSQLSKWWIQLGIRPERIEPGRPDQNGRHERMHRTLKDEAVTPPEATLEAQQRRFDEFLQGYNWERPHEALGGQSPGQVYTTSSRSYPARIPPVEYESGVEVRKVRHNGEIKWGGELLYLSEVLAHEPVGLKRVEEDRWEIRYSFHLLGYLDQRSAQIQPVRRWHGKET